MQPPASDVANPWLPQHRPDRTPAIRLFCLPCAGGGASRYRSWHQAVDEAIEVCPVQLPGRESRLNEPRLDTLHDLVNGIAEGIEPLLDRPFALLGHSLGGLLAFEVARDLRNHGLAPKHLFICGTPAPQLPRTAPHVHNLPDEELLTYLKELDGTPDRVLNEGWLRATYLPVLRDDLKVYETYLFARDAPLSCPVTTWGGMEDARVTEASLLAWKEQTRGSFTNAMFSGGHFFLDSMASELGGRISTTLLSA